MKSTKTENDNNAEITHDESVDLFSLVFQKTVFLNEQARDREAIRSWLHVPDSSD